MEAAVEVPEASRMGQRRVVVLVVVGLVLLGVGSWWWLNGGARLDDGGLTLGMVVAPGESGYGGHMLSSDGPIELRSARVGSVEGIASDDLDVEVVLVVVERGDSIPVGARDISGYEQRPIAGTVVDGPIEEQSEQFQLLMVGTRAPHEGAWRIKDLEVTYRSGNRPLRTTVVDLNLCMLATDVPDAAAWSRGQSSPPDGVAPAYWHIYSSC